LSAASSDGAVVEASKESFVAGIVSAAADNDPTTVATLAIVAASLLYGLEWLLLLIVPMFTIVQAIGTQVAAVTREGMQAAIRRRYGTLVAWISLVGIVAVNIVTYAADLDAGAAALSLLTHLDFRWFVVPVSVAIVLLLMFGTMDRIRRVLIVLPLAFVAYIAAAFLAHPHWHDVLLGFIPHVSGNATLVSSIVALIGTSLTVYSYYWQTVEVAADAPPKRAILAVQLSALPGPLITGVVMWFILIGTAATLGVTHHQVETAQDAAQALAPVAGKWASVIFGVGLFGSALLALPVIAAGSANVVSATFRWGGSLDKKPLQARRFYATLFIAVATGTAITFLNVRPMSLLFYASIAAGFATPITLALLMLLSRDAATMGKKPVNITLTVAGWCVTALVTAAALAFIRWH
jgi:Mn2+/Fe2+ NRAMP family transporter